MRHDGGVAVAAADFDGVERFGEGADLVDLDEDGVGHAVFDAVLQAFGVGHEEVVADELDVVAELVGEDLPSLPVVFGEAVFDGDDGVFLDPALVVGDHLFAESRALSDFLKTYFLVLVVEFAGGGIEGDGDLLAGLVAGLLDRFEDGFERFGVGLRVIGAKPPSSPTAVL